MKLVQGEWRNRTFAEMAEFPLENVCPLDEDILTKQKGYSFADLYYLGCYMVLFGGLSEVSVKPGKTVIVAPAMYGSAAVIGVVASGAAAVVVGRNKAALKAFEEAHKEFGRVETVVLTGDPAEDTNNLQAVTPRGFGADVYEQHVHRRCDERCQIFWEGCLHGEHSHFISPVS